MNIEKIKDYFIYGFSVLYGIIESYIMTQCILQYAKTYDGVYALIMSVSMILTFVAMYLTGEVFEAIYKMTTTSD